MRSHSNHSRNLDEVVKATLALSRIAAPLVADEPSLRLLSQTPPLETRDEAGITSTMPQSRTFPSGRLGCGLEVI